MFQKVKGQGHRDQIYTRNPLLRLIFTVFLL